MAKEVSKNLPIPIKIKGDCLVIVDETLFSVFENILRNAVIHGKTEKINIDISAEDDKCKIQIEDFGTGMPGFIKSTLF